MLGKALKLLEELRDGVNFRLKEEARYQGDSSRTSTASEAVMTATDDHDVIIIEVRKRNPGQHDTIDLSEVDSWAASLAHECRAISQRPGGLVRLKR